MLALFGWAPPTRRQTSCAVTQPDQLRRHEAPDQLRRHAVATYDTPSRMLPYDTSSHTSHAPHRGFNALPSHLANA